MSVEEGEEYARENGIIHMQTSAKTDMNVKELFMEIAKRMPKQPKEDPRVAGGCVVCVFTFDTDAAAAGNADARCTGSVVLDCFRPTLPPAAASVPVFVLLLVVAWSSSHVFCCVCRVTHDCIRMPTTTTTTTTTASSLPVAGPSPFRRRPPRRKAAASKCVLRL